MSPPGSEDHQRRTVPAISPAQGGSDAIYRSLFQLTPSGVVLIEPSGRIRTFNDRAHDQLGYDRAGFSRLYVSDIDVNEGSPGRVQAHLERIADASGEEFETLHRTRSGEVRNVLVRSQPVTVGGERLFLAVWTDITARKQAERAVREREEHLRSWFHVPAVGIAVTSPEKGWLEVNDHLCEMLGYSRDELSRLTWLAITHPADAAADVAQFDRVRAGQCDRYSLDKRFIRKDGSVLWALLSVSAVRGADGSVDHFVAVIMDIGQRKRTEAALQESEARFRSLADRLPVGVYQTDADGAVVFVNHRWLEMTGLTEEEARGPEAGNVIHPDDREQVVGRWRQSIRTGDGYGGEYRLRSPLGTETWVRAFGTALRDPAGRVVGHVGALVDITEARALQSQLAVASRLAALGTLVAGVAHEINNPLTGVLTGQAVAMEELAAARLQLGAGTPSSTAIAGLLDEAREVLQEAMASGQRVAAIVKDLSVFGRPDPKRTRLALAAVVHAGMRWLPPRVAEAALVVEDRGAPDVVASSGQLEQVVVNLVTNAVHAIPDGRRGKVIIRVGASDRGDAILEVEDDGVGIEPRVLEHVFDPFFTTRPAGKGMGLGLAISHAIATAHGGSLTATSTPGQGSTFRLELPAAD